MNATDWKKLTEEILPIIQTAGKEIKAKAGKLFENEINHKSAHDFVTDMDKKTERLLVEHLGKLLPGSAFLAEEEHKDSQKADFLWIIDPIDGTTNFIHGLFPVCISVALQHKGETVLGVVYEVEADEMFYAYPGGAFLNGEKISVSNRKSLEESLLATGFPYKNYDRLDAYLESFRYLMFHTSGLRRLGSAAADLAYVAAGRMDGFYEYGLNPWDVAAGAFIVQQAGGKVSDFSGEEDWLYGKEIITANPHIFHAFLQVVKQVRL